MTEERGRLAELGRLFLRLGSTAFGGPAAHIALMRHEVVVEREWIDDREYGQLIGLANLVPGPNSTEVAMHVGRARAGWRGLLVAGLAFILRGKGGGWSGSGAAQGALFTEAQTPQN